MEAIIFREALIWRRPQDRFIAYSLLWNKTFKKCLKVPNFDHFALSLCVLHHGVELHHRLGSGLFWPRSVVTHLYLDRPCLLGELVVHYVRYMAIIRHFCPVLLGLVHVIMLF